MARVYRATDLTTDRAVAVKLLREEAASDKEAVERLRREAEVLSSLRHDCIVAAEHYGQLPDGRTYVVMELLEGQTLRHCIKGGVFECKPLAKVLAKVASALDLAHEHGIVHRDLKPENIYLENNGGVKLLDFGISKITGLGRLTATGEVLGTPKYMAPEQLLGERDIDGRVDLYALGIITYEALTGKSPFHGTVSATELLVAILYHHVTALEELRPDLPKPIAPVVHRAMAQNRQERHATASEFAREFAQAAEM